MNLWNLPNSEKDALEFFQEKGSLPTHHECKNGHKKKLYIGKNEIDDFMFYIIITFHCCDNFRICILTFCDILCFIHDLR